MRAADSRNMVLSNSLGSRANAILLGACSLGTQAVFLRLTLSSQSGGEIYVALALGGWIASVGVGALLARYIGTRRLSTAWLLSSVIKLPLAALIFIYPSFFTGLLDPIRYLPLIMLAIAPTGLIYGSIFSLIISPEDKTSSLYGAEAFGSVVGGIGATLWAFTGLGDFGLLALIAGVELGLAFRKRASRFILPALGLAAGLTLGPAIERGLTEIRWPGFNAIKISHGPSGSWARLERQDQVTIIHNGAQIASIPDRPTAEEALFWPLLYHPDPQSMLLIGFEGIPASEYIPGGIRAIRLLFDRAYLELEVPDSSAYIISDPFAYSGDKFDIIAVRLYGAANLADYRFETERFFAHCRRLLNEEGILFVSAPADENYISSDLGSYLSSLNTTLHGLFANVWPVTSSRLGFVCRQGREGGSLRNWVDCDLGKLGLESPYFNKAMISAVYSPARELNFARALDTGGDKNEITRPRSVFHYLRWQASQLGFRERLFDMNGWLVAVLVLAVLILLPITQKMVTGLKLAPIACVYIFGLLGMAFEILILYLFQVLIGALFIHLGLLLAVLMAGLSWGALNHIKISFFHIFGTFVLAASIIAAALLAGNSGIGLIFIGGLLYLAAVASGFATGAGFALITSRFGQDRSPGSVLYGTDLFGALMATLAAPWIIMSFGATFLISSMVLISIISWMIFRLGKE